MRLQKSIMLNGRRLTGNDILRMASGPDPTGALWFGPWRIEPRRIKDLEGYVQDAHTLCGPEDADILYVGLPVDYIEGRPLRAVLVQ